MPKAAVSPIATVASTLLSTHEIALLWSAETPPTMSFVNSATTAPATPAATDMPTPTSRQVRSEEHTSELQSLMRNSYAVFCLKKNKPMNADYSSTNTTIKSTQLN